MAEKLKAAYWQRGEAIDYVNMTEETIEAGTVVSNNYLIGVAAADIPPKETGVLHIEGVFIMPKDAATPFEIGQQVCMDAATGKLQAHKNGDKPVGVVVSKPAENATSVLVKINA